MTAVAAKPGACSYREPAKEYHATPAISASGVNLFLRSPRLFEARYVLGQVIDEDRDTNALDVGTAGHCWALESDAWPDQVAIYPQELLDKNGHATTKAAKDWKAAQNGKVILKDEEFDKVRAIARALRFHPIAAELIENATDKELSIYWRCRQTGIERKSRLDMLTNWNGRDLIADLKTTSDHSPDAFGRAMHKWGYARQAAFYQEAAAAAGFGHRPFVFIVVTSTPPHVVRVREPHPRAMALARAQLAKALEEIAKRYVTGDWREELEDEIEVVDLPPWAYTEDE